MPGPYEEGGRAEAPSSRRRGEDSLRPLLAPTENGPGMPGPYEEAGGPRPPAARRRGEDSLRPRLAPTKTGRACPAPTKKRSGLGPSPLDSPASCAHDDEPGMPGPDENGQTILVGARTACARVLRPRRLLERSAPYEPPSRPDVVVDARAGMSESTARTPRAALACRSSRLGR